MDNKDTPRKKEVDHKHPQNLDAMRVSKKQLEGGMFSHNTGELLRDYKGTSYLITDDYVQKQLEQRGVSNAHEMRLIAAKQILDTALDLLTDKQRQVFIGAYVNDTIRYTARVMGISTSTAQGHLKAARKKLADLINRTSDMLENEKET